MTLYEIQNLEADFTMKFAFTNVTAPVHSHNVTVNVSVTSNLSQVHYFCC